MIGLMRSRKMLEQLLVIVFLCLMMALVMGRRSCAPFV